MKYLWLLLIVLLVPLVSAIPEIPHQFYGYVSDDNGAVSGTLTAKLCGSEFSIDVIDGDYGLNEPLLVTRDDCSDTNIEFYVDDYKAGDYSFESGGFTELNFDVPVVDNPPENPPGDSPSGGGGSPTDDGESEPVAEEEIVEEVIEEKEEAPKEENKGIPAVTGAMIGGSGSFKWLILICSLVAVIVISVLLYNKWDDIKLSLFRYKFRKYRM